MLDSGAYYDDQRAGLGDDFGVEVMAAISTIVEWPEAWPVFPGWRRSPVMRTSQVAVFPYRVVYFVRGYEVVIVAYDHNSRKPGYWRHRVQN